MESTINSTTFTTIDKNTAFCYTPIYNDKNEISHENIFTNSLNVLGSIPYVSIISGLARIIFAAIKIYQAENPKVQDHYWNHYIRGCLEVFLGGFPIPVIGNIICIWLDATNAILLLMNAIEDSLSTPSVMSTKKIFQL